MLVLEAPSFAPCDGPEKVRITLSTRCKFHSCSFKDVSALDFDEFDQTVYVNHEKVWPVVAVVSKSPVTRLVVVSANVSGSLPKLQFSGVVSLRLRTVSIDRSGVCILSSASPAVYGKVNWPFSAQNGTSSSV